MARPARTHLALVHAILGDAKGNWDSQRAEDILEDILTRHLGAQPRHEALTVFWGDEAGWGEVLASVQTGSLFVTRRAVVVRRADLLDRGQREEDRAEAEEGAETSAGPATAGTEDDAVARYVDDPSGDVVLVLLAARPRRRLRTWRAILKRAEAHVAGPLKGRELDGYLARELERRRLRLAGEAYDELKQEVGSDLRRLKGELDKLQAFAEDKELSAEDVGAVIGRGLARPLYLLGDAIAARDTASSLARLQELIEGGESEFRILPTLHHSLRRVRAARGMLDRRASGEEIAAALLPPNMRFKLPALLEAARHWTEGDLRRAMVALEQADRRLKRGIDAKTALTAAVAEACRAGELRPSPRAGR